MIPGWLMILTIFCAALLGAFLGWNKARMKRNRSATHLHSQPVYHSLYVFFWTFVPALVFYLLSSFLITQSVTHHVSNALPADVTDITYGLQQVEELAQDGAVVTPEMVRPVEVYRQMHAQGALLVTALTFLSCLFGLISSLRDVKLAFPARAQIERYTRYLFIFCASIAVFITASIVISVLFEALKFFDTVPLMSFLFGLHWNPQDTSGTEAINSFGAIPLFIGTFLIMIIALAVAAPIGLFAAIYMAEYASRTTRTFAKPILEILAGIPTVVYGYFAIVTISPLLRMAGESVGLNVASESALVAGLVMGVMIIPFISSLSDDVITAIPKSLREASFGLGATRSETITKVVLPAALPGIMGAMLLAISRAIGETMIVVMAAGLAANLTLNPLESVTTVTAQIVALLVGDQQFDSPKTLVAFALGLTLFAVTLVLNIIALLIVKQYREKYE